VSKSATQDQGYGIFYKTDDAFFSEVTRFLSTRRKNRGATEWQIHHVVQSRPFVTALEDSRKGKDSDYFRSHKEQLRFHTGLRRHAVFPVVKKLLNEGYTVAEISDALTLPYSTVYYYARKIRSHKRLREDRIRWHIDKETDCIAPMKIPRDKLAALVRKEIIEKAQKKRERRWAKRASQQPPSES
jgi:predicted transcriptional regulator